MMPKPSFVFASPVSTITIHPTVLNVFYEINEIDDEMRGIENAAMVDFLRFADFGLNSCEGAMLLKLI